MTRGLGTVGITAGGVCVSTIHVESAIYAANCGAPTPVPPIVTDCEGRESCSHLFLYTVDLGFDPAYGCPKDLSVTWTCCGDSGAPRTFYAPGESGTGTTVSLSCP